MNGGGVQKPIVLILARELASNVATPIFLVDRHGTLVFYNEPAETLVGEPFAATGEVDASAWGERFDLADPDGTPVTLEAIPTTIAVVHQRAAHRTVLATTGDGSRRLIDVTAFPLFARADELVGAITIFWEHENGSRP